MLGRLGRLASRQHQASKHWFVFSVGHGVIVLASGPQERIYFLPKELEEKVARLHMPALGAEPIVLTQEQADCTGVKVEGSFKGGHYHLGGNDYSFDALQFVCFRINIKTVTLVISHRVIFWNESKTVIKKFLAVNIPVK